MKRANAMRRLACAIFTLHGSTKSFIQNGHKARSIGVGRTRSELLSWKVDWQSEKNDADRAMLVEGV